MHNFFEKIETQLKQVLREAEMREKKVAVQTVSATANLLTAVLEGRIRQYVRSDFKTLPTQYWPEQWQLLNHAILRDVEDRKSTRLNSSHVRISYAVFCLKKK